MENKSKLYYVHGSHTQSRKFRVDYGWLPSSFWLFKGLWFLIAHMCGCVHLSASAGDQRFSCSGSGVTGNYEPTTRVLRTKFSFSVRAVYTLGRFSHLSSPQNYIMQTHFPVEISENHCGGLPRPRVCLLESFLGGYGYPREKLLFTISAHFAFVDFLL